MAAKGPTAVLIALRQKRIYSGSRSLVTSSPSKRESAGIRRRIAPPNYERAEINPRKSSAYGRIGSKKLLFEKIDECDDPLVAQLSCRNGIQVRVPD